MREHSACGVGFVTRKDGKQTHDLLIKAHEALCAVPHRGGMSSEGVGDGAGISVDLSLKFFSKIVGKQMQAGAFGVGNFFLPALPAMQAKAEKVVDEALKSQGFTVLCTRRVEVDESQIGARAIRWQLPIQQWIFEPQEVKNQQAMDMSIYRALLDIEAVAFTDPDFDGFYPLSLSSRLQVLKGRLNSWEITPYFKDLWDQDHEVKLLYFHTRFSTNTDPHPSMAQPFRLLAHNGELNTDKKNRLSEAAIAKARNRSIVQPKGQSDSCRLDQTLNSRVFGEGMDLVTAVVAMMPPAWENDKRLNPRVRDMLEYFSLYEEKNDGPAALIFSDGTVVGARLDRLGLRPMRTIETDTYLAVMSEAGQINFDPRTVIKRGRVEAGGMIYFDHAEGRSYQTSEALEKLAAAQDYSSLLTAARTTLEIQSQGEDEIKTDIFANPDLSQAGYYVAFHHNQESFKFLLDPMLQAGVEKVSAMGYGLAINAFSDLEGGAAKYFSQRFAQVTNPPLDSIREADGMTLRVALGAKPHYDNADSHQIVIPSPVLMPGDLAKIRAQDKTPCREFPILYTPDFHDSQSNEARLVEAIDQVAAAVAAFAESHGGIAILDDTAVNSDRAVLPLPLVISAVNQRLIEEGQRFRVSVIAVSGQIASSHHLCVALGFGAAAVFPTIAIARAQELYGIEAALTPYKKFKKAAEKALMKTMGKVGLCTVESYSGGEFFEPNFLNTQDPIIAKYFPNMVSPVGGVGFPLIAKSSAEWHQRAQTVTQASQIPILGLFKERNDGAGHSFGTSAVRGFVDMTEENVAFADRQVDMAGGIDGEIDLFKKLTINQMKGAFGIDEAGYSNTSFDSLTNEQIDGFSITPGYRDFSRQMARERSNRPAALRDVLAFPADIRFCREPEDFTREMAVFSRAGNNSFLVRGLTVERATKEKFVLKLTDAKPHKLARLDALAQSLIDRFGNQIEGHFVSGSALNIQCKGSALDYLSILTSAPKSIPLSEVAPASAITPMLASGAMSHGALVSKAHEGVAHGTNMVGGMSNSGEGGEHISRYGTIRASRIKQFASGRFGVWAGYLADPCLEEIEIKIGQGAKPGEGGQLPAAKVNVEIAAARGGTPGVELISPPPHHDTYSIEDLGQLIHDAKAARVRVIVKLVSSEGIGTIAVGVAKAGADLINVAGNTGGTGAAAVTSLKNTGRAAEIGLAEVHQALCANGIRQKVILRCSGALQTGSDVVKAALLGGDSFEFGTTALMMLKCVMAKNCNVKCPAGLTTNPEVYEGDPRALGQYLLNLAHEVREILATLGLRSLAEARGRAHMLHLMDHPAAVGDLDLRDMLAEVPEVRVEDPVYLEKNFDVDDALLTQMKAQVLDQGQAQVTLRPNQPLTNRNKTVGGQLAIDIERMLNHELDSLPRAAARDDRGHAFLRPGSVRILTQGSAGQSFGAFCNNGMVLEHRGTCNDGVGKSACGGEIIVKAPPGGGKGPGESVLIGNFALFGATGGRTFIEGQAGDRFAVRNSGATAVVEGVGDFCAEYMTNGSILNLGEFSKGFGNGMSGGFAYQYDPTGTIEDFISQDSVLVEPLGSAGAMAIEQAEAVKVMLTWHVAATGSAKGQAILDDWTNSLAHFYAIMPLALLQYQDADVILGTKSRKELVEELATALTQHQIAAFKDSWKAQKPVLDGNLPAYGETDNDTMFALINAFSVLEMAQVLATKRLGRKSPTSEIDKAARNLILTEDFALLSGLSKHAKIAVADYDDASLAAMVANKRLNDFKQALSQRNSISMDSPGTYAWIMHQAQKNRQILGHIPSFHQLYAGVATPDILTRMSEA